MEKWLIVASVVLTLVLLWVVWDSSRREWGEYQETYYRLALDRAQNEAQKEWARGQRFEIKQLQTKELGTVERCVTCHLAVDNPMFRFSPEPLRMHSSLLESHPPLRFGCVVCHGGEGRAVTTLDAHGQGEISAKPLLKGRYMQAACYNCHGDKTLPLKATAAVVRGRQLMNRYLCLGCHQVDGEGGEEGPDLTTVGSRRNWLWLYAHLASPQSVVVGSTMPVFPLPRQEIEDITVYLMTLWDSREQLINTSLGAKKIVRSPAPDPEEGKISQRETSIPDAQTGDRLHYDGKDLFAGAGCSFCHAIGNRGGEVGPALTYIARKRKSKDLERLLRDPEELLPGGKMPKMYLNEVQIKALVDYLSTLR